MNTTDSLNEYVNQILEELNDFKNLMNENIRKMTKPEFFDWYLNDNNPVKKYICFPKNDNLKSFGEDRWIAYNAIEDKCQTIIRLFHLFLNSDNALERQ